MLEGLYFPSGLRKPRDPPGEAGGSSEREGRLGYFAQPATAMT